MNTIEEIAKVLKGVRSAVIFTHSNPDGDAIGSALALRFALAQLQIPSEIVNSDEIPKALYYLEGVSDIKKEPTLDAEVYVAVDSSEENRFGALQEVFSRGARKSKITVNVDHHTSNRRFCQYNYVNVCPSNCQNIAKLISEMGVTMEKRIAVALMAGLVTDSGRFSYSGVDGDTFRTAALAADAGADVADITYNLYTRQTLSRAKMYTKVISNLRMFLDNRLAVAVVRKSLLEEYGQPFEATAGIVDFALSIDVVEVSVCIMESKKGQYKVSFRSKGTVNVNAVAGVFGGGGHIHASGCMLFGEEEEVLDRLRYAVSQYLEEA